MTDLLPSPKKLFWQCRIVVGRCVAGLVGVVSALCLALLTSYGWGPIVILSTINVLWAYRLYASITCRLAERGHGDDDAR
jgi:hypothetical protein